MQCYGFFRERRRRQDGRIQTFAKFLATEEGVAIIEAMVKIKSQPLRRAVIDLAEKLAEA
jgi:hypothetical protein